MESMTDARERARHLLQFLRELQEVRSRPVRNLDKYPAVLWLRDLPATDPHVSTAWASDLEASEGIWLSLERVERKPAPSIPEVLEPWVPHADIQDSSLDRPRLLPETTLRHEVITADGDTAEELRTALLDDHPYASEEFDRWVPTWLEWAEHDRRANAVRVPYQTLYTIFQEHRAKSELLEVVLGLGLLRTHSHGEPVRRHILTAKAAIDLDLDTGRIDVRLDPEEPEIHLEEDMLSPTARVAPADADLIRDSLLSQTTVFGDDGVDPLLREWTNAFSADAAFSSALDSDAEPRSTVSFAPALILRNRGREAYLQAISTVEAALESGAELPPSMWQLLADPESLESGDEPEADGFSDGETYFPLRANPQQLEVSDRLRQHRVVVVQGPPGTGKTHTIANLVTDLLAHGKRILITSHSAQALKVIKGMLPTEVRDLCVSLTDTSVKGQQALKASVETIVDQTTSQSISDLDREHESLVAELSQARDARQKAAAGLSEIRALETTPIAEDTSGRYRGTPQQVAQLLAADEPRHGWIGVVNPSAARVTGTELLHLVALQSRVDEIREQARAIPTLSDLVTPDDFVAMFTERAELDDRLSRAAGDVATEAALASAEPGSVDELQKLVSALDGELTTLASSGEDWVGQAVRDLWAGQDATVQQLAWETETALTAIRGDLATVGPRQVTGLEQVDVAAAAGRLHTLAAHLTAGGTIRRLGRIPKPVRACEAELAVVRVDGRPCTAAAEAAAAAAACSAELRLRHVEVYWGQAAAGSQGMRAARLDALLKTIRRVLALAPTFDGIRTTTSRIPELKDVPWYDAQAVRQLADVLAKDVIRRSLSELESRLQSSLTALRRTQSQVDAAQAVAAGVRALEDWNTSAYEAAWDDMQRADNANRELEELTQLHETALASSPKMATSVSDEPGEMEWQERAEALDAAYLWAEWDAYIRDIVDSDNESRLRRGLDIARDQESRALKRIAANRAWRYCQSRMTQTERQNLKVYSTSMKKIGKGTGKTAPVFRRQAREALSQAQTAVPAWIMSLRSVVDSVAFTRPGIFDVVIVDEASQSGHEALLLFWLAKRVLVVGDDEQISPENVGVDTDAVFHLQRELLGDVPRKALYGPTNSFLEHAEALALSPVLLREHFRCMPEIIEFSNRLSYDGRLLPVRQYGLDRLEPLRTTYIAHSSTRGSTGRLINGGEAEQLVETIEKCCSDPAYEGKSMGVITMLGGPQAQYVRDLLMDRLGTAEFERRHILVAGPAAFQGDERDVIFMSLVVAPDSDVGPRRIGALTKRPDQQRMNVAASRARDQVWVFHSTPGEQLPSGDFRRQYLEYLGGTQPLGQEGNLEDVQPDRPHDAFDSIFEQRVYLALVERGYRVRPQYPAGRIRIDLVVKGANASLAVECDGDEVRGLDQEGADALRQAELERLGWTFWRIRGSQFFRDPAGSLMPLWEKLEEMGIKPFVAEPPISVSEEVEAPTPSIGETALSEVAEVIEPATAVPGAVPAELPSGTIVVGEQSLRRLSLEKQTIVERLDHAAAATSGGDSVVRRAGQRAWERREHELRGRLTWIQYVLDNARSVPSDQLPDVVWPGSVIRVQDAATEELADIVVSSVGLDDDTLVHVNPTSPLGQLLANAEVGQRLSYVTESGDQVTLHVIGVSD
ncbi:MAG TPA: AAA domain-containing protein [Nocardioidaceae bacterium]|nr:AAA domain-containing protein [Nocardioidaceae bacterium]